MKKNYVLLTCFFFLLIPIGNSGMAREKLHVEFTFGSLKTIVSEDASAEKFKDLYYIYDINPLIQSPNSERVNLGLVKSFVFRESKIENVNSRLGFEYRLFRMFGLGTSYNQSSVTVTNVLPGDYLILYSLGLPPESPKNVPPEPSNFSTLNSRDLRSTISTAEVEASIHLLPNVKHLDPFIRLGYGTALRGISGSSQKFSTSAGIRYIYNEKWSVSLEYYKGDLFGNLGRTNFVVESGGRVGLGIYF
jgi:hypothetical protein